MHLQCLCPDQVSQLRLHHDVVTHNPTYENEALCLSQATCPLSVNYSSAILHVFIHGPFWGHYLMAEGREMWRTIR